MAHVETRDAPINIRARQSQRELIDRAAATLNKNRSDFILEASCREAENVLLDQRLFFLDGQKFKEFDAALKKPVSENPQIQKLFARNAPWEK
jgi:uncharacterized protein (DUF1778 family)